MKSPEQLFMELGGEFTDLIIDTNSKLISSVDNEEYEKAAQHRDMIAQIIEHTVQLSLLLLEMDEGTIRESFTKQNEIVYNALLNEYNENRK